MKYIWLGIFLLGHILDMVFTVIYLSNAKKKIENPEELEINYHKYFFKKFGLIKGAAMSCVISLTFITIAYLVLYNTYDFYFITFAIGLQWGIAYSNYISISHMNNKNIKRKCQAEKHI